jgi:nitrogen regulatory protein PII 2
MRIVAMKEIQAFIRPNKVNATKEALANVGFPAFLARKCLGRGKQGLEAATVKLVLESGELPVSQEGEALTEVMRLVPKRFFSLVVEDEQVDLAVKTIVEVNQTGNPGDGRIFVAPILETSSVRKGKPGL